MKKAFTLIELLAVLIILGVIIAIIIPVTNGIINNSKQNAFDSQVEILLDQALKYSVQNSLGMETINKGLQFQDLVNAGLIQSVPTNPISGESLQGCILYRWDISINQYVFEYSEICAETKYNEMINGGDFNEKVRTLAGFSNVTKISFYSSMENVAGESVDLSLNNDGSIIAFIDGDTLKIQNDGIILANENIGFHLEKPNDYSTSKSAMFQDFYNTTEINFFDKGMNVFDTSNTVNMFGLFSSSSFSSLDLRGFNTENVIDMRDMFAFTYNLNTLDLSSFNFDKIQEIECFLLENPDASYFITTYVPAALQSEASYCTPR